MYQVVRFPGTKTNACPAESSFLQKESVPWSLMLPPLWWVLGILVLMLVCEVLWEEPFGCLCADSGCLASVSSQTESLYFPASLILTEGYLENEAERARGVWEAPNASVACYISILCSAVRPVYDDEQVLIPVTSRQVTLPTSVYDTWAQRGWNRPSFSKTNVLCPDSSDGTGAEYWRQHGTSDLGCHWNSPDSV